MKIPITRGNHKLPNTTAVFNIGPAATCPSRALGLCQLDRCGVGSQKCYALKAEMTYGRPHALRHRMRQQEWWDTPGVINVADGISDWIAKCRTPTKALRLNESGDFRHQGDVNRLCFVADLLQVRWPKLKIYCYTARRDLQFAGLPENVTINGSGFMVHNRYVILAGDQAETKTDLLCKGDCRICSACLTRKGLTIGNKLH